MMPSTVRTGCLVEAKPALWDLDILGQLGGSAPSAWSVSLLSDDVGGAGTGASRC